MAPKKKLNLPGLKALRESVIPGSKAPRSAFTTNLSSIKEALTPSAKKKVKARFAKAADKNSYTFRELPIPRQKNFVEYSHYIERHSNELDKLLKPGERWAATYFGNHTHLPFDNIYSLMGRLNEYKDSEKFGKSTDMSQLVSKIRIIKFKSPTGNKRGKAAQKAYAAMKAEEVRVRDEKRTNREKRAVAKQLASEKKLRLAEKKRKAERAKNKKQVASLLGQIKKLTGKNNAKKKTAKKVATPKRSNKVTKKTVVKKSAKKVSKKIAPKKSAVKKATKKVATKKVAAKKQTKKVAKRVTKKASKKR